MVATDIAAVDVPVQAKPSPLKAFGLLLGAIAMIAGYLWPRSVRE